MASLRTVDEAAWFARDDFLPFGLMRLRMTGRLVSGPLARHSRPGKRNNPQYRPGRAAANLGAGSSLLRRQSNCCRRQSNHSIRPPSRQCRVLARRRSAYERRRRCGDRGSRAYGLSLAAHLRAAGVSLRQFGLPMQLWQTSMPRGMFLKSQGFASNLSSPDGEHTLEAFCKLSLPYASYGLPVPSTDRSRMAPWFPAGAHS